MNSFQEIEAYILNYQPTGIIIDTQVLVLLLIGNYNPSLIKGCKITSSFSTDDFDNLKKILRCFESREKIITSHILAELSNLSKKAFSDKSKNLYAYFYSVIEFLKSTKETTYPIDSFLNIDIKVISDYGFTDIGIVETASKSKYKLAILTNDTDLHSYSLGRHVPVIKLAHFRDYKGYN